VWNVAADIGLDVWVARREYDERPDVLAFLAAASEALQTS